MYIPEITSTLTQAGLRLIETLIKRARIYGGVTNLSKYMVLEHWLISAHEKEEALKDALNHAQASFADYTIAHRKWLNVFAELLQYADSNYYAFIENLWCAYVFDIPEVLEILQTQYQEIRPEVSLDTGGYFPQSWSDWDEPVNLFMQLVVEYVSDPQDAKQWHIVFSPDIGRLILEKLYNDIDMQAELINSRIQEILELNNNWQAEWETLSPSFRIALLHAFAEEQPDGWIDPSYVEAKFNEVFEALKPDGPGRPPTRAQRIYEVFRGQENANVPLDEIAKKFINNKDPRHHASIAVNWLNSVFEEVGVDLEIVGSTVYRLKKRS